MLPLRGQIRRVFWCSQWAAAAVMVGSMSVVRLVSPVRVLVRLLSVLVAPVVPVARELQLQGK
ncbi:hypothetical protein B6B06_004743 [Salmonella enterica subsp. enterica serovar Berta]